MVLKTRINIDLNQFIRKLSYCILNFECLTFVRIIILSFKCIHELVEILVIGRTLLKRTLNESMKTHFTAFSLNHITSLRTAVLVINKT